MKSFPLAILFLPLLFSCQQTPLQIKTELLFGLTDQTLSRSITPEEWESFSQSQITPRFPEGFTVLNHCTGAWLSQKFGATSEPCKIVVIVHPPSASVNQKIHAIIQAYNTQFHQEAVLRIDTRVQYQFQ